MGKRKKLAGKALNVSETIPAIPQQVGNALMGGGFVMSDGGWIGFNANTANADSDTRTEPIVVIHQPSTKGIEDSWPVMQVMPRAIKAAAIWRIVRRHRQWRGTIPNKFRAKQIVAELNDCRASGDPKLTIKDLYRFRELARKALR